MRVWGVLGAWGALVCRVLLGRFGVLPGLLVPLLSAVALRAAMLLWWGWCGSGGRPISVLKFCTHFIMSITNNAIKKGITICTVCLRNAYGMSRTKSRCRRGGPDAARASAASRWFGSAALSSFVSVVFGVGLGRAGALLGGAGRVGRVVARRTTFFKACLFSQLTDGKRG